MPIYEYECAACGLRFEKMKSLSKMDNPESCLECETPNARKLMSPTNFAFAHEVVGGPRPQNTGVHSIDYNYDRVIGQDAEQKWKAISERQKHKIGVIKDNPGATGHDLSRTLDGDYRVMSPAERQASERGRALGNAARAAVQDTVQKNKP